MASFRKPRDRREFKIAIFCALTLERDAVIEMFDERWEASEYKKAPGDTNTYSLGRIGAHHVVATRLPGMGIQEAASASTSLRSSFQNIALALVVGICGGVPTKTKSGEILMGDVIISTELIDLTFGRQFDHKFAIKDNLADRFGRPSKEIRGFLGTLEGRSDRARLKARSSVYLTKLCQTPGFESFQYPGADKDIVYQRSYRHKHQRVGSCVDCAICQVAEDEYTEANAAAKPAYAIDQAEDKVKRALVCVQSETLSCEVLGCDKTRCAIQTSSDRALISDTKIREPEIHFGAFGSGTSVLKSGYARDELANKNNVIAFEMEGAGVWDNFPTTVVKAVCDYADSHKSKDWQGYAAASAAACAKAFLAEWPVADEPSHGTARARTAGADRKQQRFPFPRNDDFITRNDIFSKLEMLLPLQSSLQSAALWGLGGSGKTQIALEFAYRRHLEYHCPIFWVTISSYDHFIQGYRQIATDAGLPADLQDVKLLAAVRSWLESQTDWLLVLDNADDLSLFGSGYSTTVTDDRPNLITFIPQGSSGHILWTTRDEKAVGHLVSMSHGISVGDMSTEEAKDLLTGLSNEPRTTENAVFVSGIVEQLECLPLAISQAAAFIREKRMTYRNYFGRLSQERKRWRVLSEDGSKRYRPDGVPHNVMQTWRITMDYLKYAHPLSHWILSAIVYFHNQDIPWFLIKAIGLQRLQDKRHPQESVNGEHEQAHSSNDEATDKDNDSDYDEDEIRSALNRLAQFSLVRIQSARDEESLGYNIHKLVQDATRYAIQQDTKTHKQPRSGLTTAEVAIQELSKVFPTGGYGTSNVCARLITHVLAIRQWPELENQRVKMCEMLYEASTYLIKQEMLSSAEELRRQVLELWKASLGEHHIYTLRSMTRLAVVCNHRRRLDEAEELSLYALSTQKAMLGEKNLDTLYTMSCLATTYYLQKRLDEAEKIELQILASITENSEEKDPWRLSTMRNLASTWHKQKRYVEAEKMKVKLVQLNKEVFGERHPNTLKSMSELVKTFYEQDRLEEAQELGQRALNLYREVLGRKHPDTLWTMGILAYVYQYLGRTGEAEELFVDLMVIRKEVLGEDHPDTIWSVECVRELYPARLESSHDPTPRDPVWADEVADLEMTG